MWNEIIALYENKVKARNNRPNSWDYEKKFRAAKQEAAKKKKIKVEKLSLEDQKAIATPFLDEYTRLKDAADREVANWDNQLSAKLEELKLGDIPMTTTQIVGSWGEYNYSTQPAAKTYAEWRAKAQSLVWKELGFVSRHEWNMDTNQWDCLVTIDGPVGLVNDLPPYFMAHHQLLKLIYDHIPACNVKVLFHNNSLPNRWD